MHFGTKSYLKSTRNHTVKHALSPFLTMAWGMFTHLYRQSCKTCMKMRRQATNYLLLEKYNYFKYFPSNNLLYL
jgi:hypothetical protein